MGKTVQIPDELHEALEARARAEGVSMGEYLAHVMGMTMSRCTPVEVLERIRSREPVDLGISAADLIRQGREERTLQLTEPWLSSTPQR
jgi:hypothetical protein